MKTYGKTLKDQDEILASAVYISLRDDSNDYSGSTRREMKLVCETVISELAYRSAEKKDDTIAARRALTLATAEDSQSLRRYDRIVNNAINKLISLQGVQLRRS